MFQIARATAEDSAAVERLRREAYQAAPEFNVTDERFVGWGKEDVEGIVLVVSHAGAMVSTTRGNLLRNREEAERFMECDLSDVPLPYPALVLGKGATSRQFAGHGLHSALRYAFIRAAQDCGLASVAGVVFEGAPRTRLMLRIGYEYFSPKRTWYSNVGLNAKTLVAVLPRDRYAMALGTLTKEVDVSWVGPSVHDELAAPIRGALAAVRGPPAVA